MKKVIAVFTKCNQILIQGSQIRIILSFLSIINIQFIIGHINERGISFGDFKCKRRRRMIKNKSFYFQPINIISNIFIYFLKMEFCLKFFKTDREIIRKHLLFHFFFNAQSIAGNTIKCHFVLRIKKGYEERDTLNMIPMIMGNKYVNILLIFAIDNMFTKLSYS